MTTPSASRELQRRGDDKITPIATLLRAWAHNEGTKRETDANPGPNQYLIDLLLDAADEHDAVLALSSSIEAPKHGDLSCDDMETLRRAINESGDCLPKCDSYAHEENCPNANIVARMIDMQKEIEALRRNPSTGVPPFKEVTSSFNHHPGKGDKQEPVVEVTFEDGDWDARDRFAEFLKSSAITAREQIGAVAPSFWCRKATSCKEQCSLCKDMAAFGASK